MRRTALCDPRERKFRREWKGYAKLGSENKEFDPVDVEFEVKFPETTGRTPRIPGLKRTRFVDQDFIREDGYYYPPENSIMSDTSGSRSSQTPRPIEKPPRDVSWVGLQMRYKRGIAGFKGLISSCLTA